MSQSEESTETQSVGTRSEETQSKPQAEGTQSEERQKERTRTTGRKEPRGQRDQPRGQRDQKNQRDQEDQREKALKPEDLTRLFVDRANAGDAEGIALLYEEHAVMAYPPGLRTVGREAIRTLWEKVLASAPRFDPEPPLPTLISGDIALTATPPKDGAGARAQVVRRQPDGTWLRLLDQPEFLTPGSAESGG